jgi:putative zinc finger protein
MDCGKALKLLHGYLDDSLSWQEADSVDQHLQVCSHCAREHHELEALRQVLSSIKRWEPPQDLGLKMKIEASKQDYSLALEKLFSKLEDFLRPIAIPAFSGVALTFLFFLVLLSTFLPGANLSASDKDIPLSLFTEPKAKSLYRSQFVQLENFKSAQEPITVEADVANNGRVVDYKILNGPKDRATVRSLNQFFFFEAYIDPATLFGRPISGKIILTLSFYPTSDNKIDVVG